MPHLHLLMREPWLSSRQGLAFVVYGGNGVIHNQKMEVQQVMPLLCLQEFQRYVLNCYKAMKQSTPIYKQIHCLLECYDVTDFIMAPSNPLRGIRKGEVKIIPEDGGGTGTTEVGDPCVGKRHTGNSLMITKQSFIDGGPRLYMVTLNNYFFVLKVEHDAYYLIDTLGERLYKGCGQAYILMFGGKHKNSYNKHLVSLLRREHGSSLS